MPRTRARRAPARASAKPQSVFDTLKFRNDSRERIRAAIKALADVKIKGELTSLDELKRIECWPTGVQTIDDLISGEVVKGKTIKGSGRGFPKGRLVEVFGPESVSKTTLALLLIARVQALGGVCAFIDAEHALDLSYAAKLGVDIEELIIVDDIYTAEEAYSAFHRLIPQCDVIVLDSLDNCVPRKIVEADEDEEHPGLAARMTSRFVRKAAAAVEKHGTTGFLINQLRMKVGMFFGSPETVGGGNGPKYYAAVRIDLRKEQEIKSVDDDPIGVRIRAKTVKNKIATPWREAVFDVIWNEGVRVPSRKQVLADREARRERFKKKGKKK